ncbi:unnamed protein product [Paramecium sonneborni]|uniref:Uncharacterized protein n=1 Tax=Paramecium sonneborni TaxID=65129 RepID=A0A8S1MTD0_9CILI|nr:unnamed protein product [Paramecium sonneborni]
MQKQVNKINQCLRSPELNFNVNYFQMMQFGFLWIIVQCVTGIKKVVSTSFTQTTPFIDRQGWQISNYYNQGYSLCRDVQLFGGNHEFDMSTGINKLFNLEPHYKLYLSLVVYIIDMTWPQAINVMVDQLPNQFIIPMGSNDLCGQSQVENSYNINLSLIHSYPTTIISIFSSIDSTSIYWGIRELVLSVDTCPPGCQICFQESQVFECSQWKLFHESWMSKDLRDFNADGWQTTQVSGPTDCASISMYGGYNSMTVGGALQKTFQLGAHSNLYFIYRFIKIDNWSGEYGTFKIENANYQMLYNGGGTQKNYCGDPSYPDQFHIYGIEYPHDGQFVTVLITSQQYNQGRYFGIRDFQIYGYTTPSYCGDGIVDYNEQCDDGNIYAFDSCFNCQFYCVEGCSNCITGMCINCQEGWVFDILNYQCIYQQFQLLDKQIEYQIVQKQDNIHILTYKEKDCKEFNYQNQCIKCKKGYQLDWQGTCQTVCGDGIIAGNEECEIGILKNCNKNCKYQCQEECKQCIFGRCKQCRSGFELQNNKCIERCGDWQIQREEECDDGNMIRFDGCHNCQNECQDQCLDCKFGQCMRCQDGWILMNGNCEFKCGDSIIAQGVEECDDGNDIQFDGCYNCKLECDDQGCSACYLGVCYNCYHPLTLYKDQCLVICGDGLLAEGFEDCDDGNDIPYDGCYKCKYQCYKECKICEKGVCIDECDFGYYLMNQTCLPLCGDKIITYHEQCDDGNFIEFDGCYQCNYSCPQNCQICEQGICHKCIFGFYLIGQIWFSSIPK